ncbi:hypothetical protein KP509_16G082500 [Ceratopteris richardii]|nr:hypothetical protein KP509_16G082500 [Ceratopteris richardii]
MEKKEKHLQHALADSAQLRAQLSALETVNGQQHDSSDALKMDLAKALERATSSEAEVERYNKEIRKLRERLKSTQDEAYRLDSELKANASYFQKEKDGIAKENQVLLEQLARKDEELFSYVQEINNLKNVFTCLKVSRLELERLKSELQNNTFEETPETMGWYVLQNQIKSEGPLMGLNDAKQNAVPSDPVLSQILEVLQKLTNCLPKNETQLESSEVKVPESEEKHMVRSDRPQKGALYSEAAVNCKSMGNVGQVSSLNPKNDSTGDPCSACSQMLERKGEILFIITCWKWRWFIAARTVQKLSKEISSLKSVKKGKIRDVQQSPFLNFLDNINPSGVNGHAKNARPSNISFQEPIGADKMLTLLASICKLSSRSAHQEKEAYDKGRRFDHLLRIMMRWMQRARKRRQLERVITHWLRYLLQSCKDKFKKCNMAVSQAVNPGKGSCHTSHFMNTSQLASIPRARIVGNISTDFRKECQRSEKYEHTCKSQAFTTLQESLHQEFEVLEYSILKAISNWQQKECGDADISSEGFRESPTSLLWKISCDMEHCFFESRNQIMAYFGVKNASSATNISKVHRSISTFPSKPLIRQMRLKVGNCKKPPEKSSFPQCVARKKKKIFL